MKKSITTRIAILDCAIALFKEQGYDKVTIKQICEASDVAKSTFYYHYQTKEDLIKDFFKHIDINVEQMMQALLEDGNYLEQMWKMIEMYYLRLIDAGVEITKIVYSSNLANDKHILGENNAIAKDAYLKLLSKALESKLIQPVETSVEVLLSTLVYSLTGISYLWCVNNGNFDLIAECRKVFETILQYHP